MFLLFIVYILIKFCLWCLSQANRFQISGGALGIVSPS